MLDNEQQPTESNESAVDPSLPKPPAGRRSRRRPAGPPAQVVETARIVETAPGVEAVAPEPVETGPAEPGPAEPEAEAFPSSPEEAATEEPEAEEPEAEEPEAEQPEAEQPEEPALSEADEVAEIEEVAEHADEAASEQPDDDEEAEDRSADRSEQHQGDGTSRRRRRRRGGRRRHTGTEGQTDEESEEPEESSESSESSETTEEAERGGHEPQPGRKSRRRRSEEAEAESSEPDEVSEDSEGEEGHADTDSGSASSRRRRRRRRRRGEDATAGAEDDPSVVVVKVRESHPADDQIHAVEGSTRLEAKRQRRREGRAAGRRRAPIVSESEFLARRESVKRQMVLRQSDEFSQIAVLEDGVLVEHYVDRESSSSLIGNIYLGRVQNVLPSMEAAFIDIGRGRNAVLYAGEVDWDAYGAANSERKIEHVLKSGQQILVQVTKDPVGAKGARLTNHVSIPGRYVVYAPGGHLSGISRKLPDVERKRLKHILAELIEEGASVIVRTAAEGATQDQLVHDVSRLKAQWDAIEKKSKQGGAPLQLYSEPDLTIRTVRDLFTEDFAELVIDGRGDEDDAYATLTEYLEHVAPHLRERVVHWDRAAKGDVFSHFRLDEQIAKALERKVHLPSGGSLVIDRTEAMTVIDVNTGKFTGHGGNLEATVTANNLEAAEEIVRQLRLRDIGGIIVVDFIDMVLPSNRELLLRRLVECLGRDRTRHQVSEVTSLGLVQMTRKKIGTGLAEAFTEPCEVCNQRGYIVHDMPVATQAPADGGDRPGRNSRKRSRGGKGAGNASSAGAQNATPEQNGQQNRSKPETEPEHVSEEARAAAQAAIAAVAHAGVKPHGEEQRSALLDDVVAALQEGRSADEAEATGASQEAVVPETAPTRRRSTGRARSRRAAKATEETAAEATPVEETPAEESPAEESPAEESPMEAVSSAEAPATEAPATEATEQESSTPEAPVVPAGEESAQQEPADTAPGGPGEAGEAAPATTTKRATRKTAARSPRKTAAKKTTTRRTGARAAAADPVGDPTPAEHAPSEPDPAPLQEDQPSAQKDQPEQPQDQPEQPLDQEPIDMDTDDMDRVEVAPVERVRAEDDGPESTEGSAV